MEAADNEWNTVSRREFVFFENVNRNRPETSSDINKNMKTALF
jgi:hypothetical protein